MDFKNWNLIPAEEFHMRRKGAATELRDSGFLESTSCNTQLADTALDLSAAPASQAYVEHMDAGRECHSPLR